MTIGVFELRSVIWLFQSIDVIVLSCIQKVNAVPIAGLLSVQYLWLWNIAALPEEILLEKIFHALLLIVNFLLNNLGLAGVGIISDD